MVPLNFYLKSVPVNKVESSLKDFYTVLIISLFLQHYTATGYKIGQFFNVRWGANIIKFSLNLSHYYHVILYFRLLTNKIFFLVRAFFIKNRNILFQISSGAKAPYNLCLQLLLILNNLVYKLRIKIKLFWFVSFCIN